MKNLTRIEGPADEPITLAQAKSFLRETNTDEDAYITTLISVARESVEEYTRRALLEQTWKLTMDAFPDCMSIELDRSPLVSVETVKYWPSDGGDQVTLDEGSYLAIPGLVPGLVQFKKSVITKWPDTYSRADAVEISFTAGNTDAPYRAVQAIYMLISNWYENRLPVVQGTIVAKLPINVEWLLSNLKVSGWTV